jgi:hypothetical protein
MVAFDATRWSDSSTQPAVDSVAVQLPDGLEPTFIRSCRRLGRIANPPGFSFSDWLRDRRSR